MGYIGQRMSERAMEAYTDGEMPKSKWTKNNILNAIFNCLKENNCKCDEKYFINFTKDDLFTEFIIYKSWHHTGKYYNETAFYGLDEDRIEELLEFINNDLEKCELFLQENNIKNEKFNISQMQQISDGLENGLTKEQVSIYANEKYNREQMEQIRQRLEQDLTNAME